MNNYYTYAYLPNGKIWEEYTSLREFCIKNNIERNQFNRYWTVEQVTTTH